MLRIVKPACYCNSEDVKTQQRDDIGEYERTKRAFHLLFIILFDARLKKGKISVINLSEIQTDNEIQLLQANCSSPY